MNSIPFYKTGYFSKISCDYLEQNDKIAPFYNNYPNLSGFKKQLEEKSKSPLVSKSQRKVLVETLNKQYKHLNVSPQTASNIESLLSENTFTITTGHQLNLFTGPLYFLYKIVSVLNLVKQLKNEFSDHNFVPIYWMATEDHDFKEINFFNFNEKKIEWSTESNTAVGRLLTTGLDKVADEFSKFLDTSKNSKHLIELFKKAYIEHKTLTSATRYLVNELFGEYGLVILDGDAKLLKKQFAPFVENELNNQISFKQVSKTILHLKKEYKIQVNPREINLFYLTDELRERIIFEDGFYKVVNTNISWSKSEILKEVYDFPERFSPNVILRPLYQEVILPNLCYVGGGGELAYWFELKSYFEAVKVPFPILLLRNSVVLVSEKQSAKAKKLNITIEDLFLKQHVLVNKVIKEVSEIKIDFSEQKKQLEKQFKDLEKLAKQTDKSFIGAVKAQETKQLKGLDKLEKRLLKAQKRKLKDVVNRLTDLQDQLFPNQSLEERQRNFSEIYEKHGAALIPKLINTLDPLKMEFNCISI